jgi:hypothetical protein
VATVATAALPPITANRPALVAGWRSRLLGLLNHEARRYLLPIAALSAVSAVGTLAVPWLRAAPLLLVALSPRLPFLVMASASCPGPLLFAVATARLCAADVHHYKLGRLYGVEALAKLPLVGRLAPRMEGAAGRTAAVVAVLVRPIGRHLVLAGTTTVSGRWVAAADVAATAAYVLAVQGVGATFL